MERHQRVDSGSWACTQGPSFSAQYIGRMYSAVSLANLATPSCASLIQVSVDTTGFRYSLIAESLTRAQWRSRSGVTPSKYRAPSNTIEKSQDACVRGPMMGTLPSCHRSSKYVQVLEKLSAGDKPFLRGKKKLVKKTRRASKAGPRRRWIFLTR